MQFGRCSVRTFYPPALEVLRNHLDIFSSFVEHKVGINEAEEVSRTADCLRSERWTTDCAVLH
jgi:hypothetical protein